MMLRSPFVKLDEVYIVFRDKPLSTVPCLIPCKLQMQDTLGLE